MSAALKLEAFDDISLLERKKREALSAAERRGYEMGHADARAASEADRVAEMSAAEAAAHAVVTAAREFAVARETHAAAAARCAAEIIRLSLPRLAERGLAAEIGALVREASASGMHDILVETSEDLAARCGAELNDLPGVAVEPADDLAGPQARVRWTGGEARFDLSALDAALDRVLATTF